MSTGGGRGGTDPSARGDEASDRRGLHQWPFSLVLTGLVVSIVVVALGHFRRGSVLLAGVVVLATFLRLFLRDDEAGLLAVRSKLVDVICLAVLGVGLAALSFAVPAPS